MILYIVFFFLISGALAYLLALSPFRIYFAIYVYIILMGVHMLLLSCSSQAFEDKESCPNYYLSAFGKLINGRKAKR